MPSIGHRIFEIIETGKAGDRWSRLFDAGLIIIIVLNVVAIVLESFEELSDDFAPYFFAFEIVSITLFTLEYFLRVATANHAYPDLGPIAARLRWIFSFSGLIDLLAILPFFVPLVITFDLRFLRMVRILRLLRILKLNRYSRSIQIIGFILNDKKEELLTTLFVSGILMIIASTFMYYLENEAQPDAFPNVVATMWWAVATLTTVGYGDIFPITTAGKVFAGIISVLGIGIIALPTGILSAAFIEYIDQKKAAARAAANTASPRFCPHCGEDLRTHAHEGESP
ncbi:MAG: ion transporter [bacterium]|nr:ion transporter [bacterium]